MDTAENSDRKYNAKPGWKNSEIYFLKSFEFDLQKHKLEAICSNGWADHKWANLFELQQCQARRRRIPWMQANSRDWNFQIKLEFEIDKKNTW